MREDHLTEVHRGNSENLSGPHHRAGEAACVPWTRGAGEDGRIHATGACLFFTSDIILSVLKCTNPLLRAQKYLFLNSSKRLNSRKDV